MNEEELKQLEESLKSKEAELNKKEEDLKTREDLLNEDKEDTGSIIKSVKEEYESKVKGLTEKYEGRLKERDKVIKQLLSSDGNANKPSQNTIVDKINAHRTAQNKKW